MTRQATCDQPAVLPQLLNQFAQSVYCWWLHTVALSSMARVLALGCICAVVLTVCVRHVVLQCSILSYLHFCKNTRNASEYSKSCWCVYYTVFTHQIIIPDAVVPVSILVNSSWSGFIPCHVHTCSNSSMIPVLVCSFPVTFVAVLKQKSGLKCLPTYPWL